MSILNKITTFIQPGYTKEELEKALHQTSFLIPHPNDDIEFVRPLFNSRKYYNHLKKRMWKFHK